MDSSSSRHFDLYSKICFKERFEYYPICCGSISQFGSLPPPNFCIVPLSLSMSPCHHCAVITQSILPPLYTNTHTHTLAHSNVCTKPHTRTCEQTKKHRRRRRKVRNQLRLPVELGRLRPPHRTYWPLEQHRHRVHAVHQLEREQGGRPHQCAARSEPGEFVTPLLGGHAVGNKQFLTCFFFASSSSRSSTRSWSR